MLRLLVFSTLFVPIFSYSEKYKQIAEKCCGEKNECCLEAMQKVKRINDCYSNSLEEEKMAANCIQNQLFGQISLEFATFSDMQCCSVFDYDDNDVGGLCRSSCISAFTTPSMSSTQKLNIIKHCRQDGDQDNYTCVRKCQLWQRKVANGSIEAAPFPIEKHCNLAANMIEGKMYLGTEISLEVH